MRSFFLTTAGELADAIENWMIDNKCNPKTPEEWERCMRDITAVGQAEHLGDVEDEDAEKIKKNLLDSGGKELKDVLKDNEHENS